MAFNAAALTALQVQLTNFSNGKLFQVVGAVDVLGGAIINSSGAITVGGRALSNQQYAQIYEMVMDAF